MINNKKVRKQLIGENLTIWLLALLTYYGLMEHNNFITIIFLILFVAVSVVFNVLGKKGILANIYIRHNDSNDKFIQVCSVIVLQIFALYARDTGTGKGIFYFTFFALSITDMIRQYKKLGSI
ncbi:hypothetical protein [Clostridium peptidivorans]|uniref:hypothetical protein n=1 Tax=Clostridium peptidivorans TaxID=100174 RepID=UPI000BE30806|nr:hypothetical protein [Clostridium peptidivorans]